METKNLTVPIAIVVAGALIGAALFFTHRDSIPTPLGGTAPATQTTKDIPPVTAADHIRGGDINTPIIIVEYSDLECPFCKQFDATMKQVLAAYPGKVAWVIRNFPLQQLHPNAPKLALAAECIASLNGNDAYWKFLDSIIQQAPINTFFDMTKLTATAEGVGVNGKTFDSCVASGKFESKISAEFNDAVAAGGQGTPFSVIVVTKTGKKIPVPGSQPYDLLKATIDSELAGK